MATSRQSITGRMLAFGALFKQIGIIGSFKGAAAPSLRVSAPAPRRDAVTKKSETPYDDFSIKLTAEEVAAAKKALTDPHRVAELHEAGRRRYDARWGLDPNSPTRIEAVSIKKAP